MEDLRRRQDAGWGRTLLLLLDGVLMGGGSVLPGVSAGVLCVVFGLYEPLMNVIAHPKTELPRYGRLLLPVAIGWIVGFFGVARLLETLFAASQTVGAWLFIGLIVGTLPRLIREAGSRGTDKHAYLALAVSFAAFFAVLLFVRIGAFPKVVPNAWWYVFCGVLWGFSVVVPGLNFSPMLLSLGLLLPLNSAIAHFDLPVLALWLLGMVTTAALLARAVSRLFERFYGPMRFAVLGVTVASTLMIVPIAYADAGVVWLSALCFGIGLLAAWGLKRMERGRGEPPS